MSAPAPGYTIHVSGLAPETNETKLHDFFSFCGKLVSVNKNGNTADITFEKLSAMRTSLMLNGGTLDGAHLEVTSASDSEPKAASILPTGATGSTPIGASSAHHDISQEDKPRAAIVAEYLAHGYVMGDHVIEKAIDFDQKQGISSRFLNFFNSLDQKAGAKLVGEDKTVSGKVTEQAQAVLAKTKEVDQNRGVSSTFDNYYRKALGTSVGQRVHSFYTTTQKQVLDVHEEARRIADEKKAAAVPAVGTNTTSATETTPIAPATTTPVAATSTFTPAPINAPPL